MTMSSELPDKISTLDRLVEWFREEVPAKHRHTAARALRETQDELTLAIEMLEATLVE